MPLTDYQAEVARLLAANRSPDSYLAGGSAIHLQPNTTRYSNDLDYFNDSVERVATAFAVDQKQLVDAGYVVSIDIQQPGYIRARVARDEQETDDQVTDKHVTRVTKVEWAHDSAWRFMPTVACDRVGFRLHPVDLAINKVLTLAGRNEPRDFIDVLHVCTEVLPLGGLCWAAAGKDPGFTPLSLLELLRRRGVYRSEDFARLHLTEPVDLVALKTAWRTALDDAERFITSRPPEEIGCLYYSKESQSFVEPQGTADEALPHFGRPGGVLPRVERDDSSHCDA